MFSRASLHARGVRLFGGAAIALAFCSLAAPAAAADGLVWRRGGVDPAAPAPPTQAGGTTSTLRFEPVTPAPKPAPAAAAKPKASRAKRPTKAVPAPPAEAPAANEAPVEEQASSDRSRVYDPAITPAVATAPVASGAAYDDSVELASCPGPTCGCAEPGCGIPEPSCYFAEPGCGCVDPGCCVGEPACGFEEPICGCPDPGCGCATGPVGCGDCGCGDIACCGDYVGPGPCGPGGLGRCVERGAIPICIFLPPIKEVTLFAGVQGFKSPRDYLPGVASDAGNFGFNQGVNLGGRMSWLPWPRLGWQVGYRATQNQLSGDSLAGTSDNFSQHFLTAGLFRRCEFGWQYGLVYDQLHDDRQASLDFSQVRGLVSVTNRRGGEFGFQFTASTSDEVLAGTTFGAADQYLFFYRHNGWTGGELRALAGGSENHGILGADLVAPLNHWWSIQTGFNYFIPSDGGNIGQEASEEAWNVGVNLVWHWGGRGKSWYKSPWRPLFNVADNGSLMIDDRD